MRPVILAVRDDEPAWSLRERNQAAGVGYKRFQVITVVRNDDLAEWWTELGPAENFSAPEVEIPSLLVHTVAELREIADQHRWRDNYWEKFTAEQVAESTLIPDFINQVEEHWKVIRNQSVFGPGGTTQRNGFSKRAAYEYQEAVNGNS